MKTTVSLLTMLLLLSCHKEEATPDELPECIRERIAQLQKADTQNPPAKVYQYSYKGEPVYYFTADCCDMYNVVVNSQCDTLCAPDGGFTGKGDGRCADFASEAKDQVLIWEDSRK